jgi:hypothetical protein
MTRTKQLERALQAMVDQANMAQPHFERGKGLQILKAAILALEADDRTPGQKVVDDCEDELAQLPGWRSSRRYAMAKTWYGPAVCYPWF